MKWDILILRVAFVGLLVLLGYMLNPFERTQRFGLASVSDENARRFLSAFLGLVTGLIILGFEIRVRRASLKTLIGAAVGSILGITGAFLIGVLIIMQQGLGNETKIFLTLSLVFFMSYVGLMVGAAKGDYLELSSLGGIFSDKA